MLAVMNRRTFLTSVGATGAALAFPSSVAGAPANKRERMLQWLAGKTDPHYTPAAFFLHFGKEYKDGSAAAKRHLEFFRATDMDFVKIQFEQTYERQEFLKKPADWSKLALRKLDFYESPLQTVRDVVKAAKKDALILMTLYSPFMCAGHCATSQVLRDHLEENPSTGVRVSLASDGESCDVLLAGIPGRIRVTRHTVTVLGRTHDATGLLDHFLQFLDRFDTGGSHWPMLSG